MDEVRTVGNVQPLQIDLQLIFAGWNPNLKYFPAHEVHHGYRFGRLVKSSQVECGVVFGRIGYGFYTNIR